MFTQSLWNSFSGTTNFPSLNKDINVDVAIIGGGITGISTAKLLAKSGFSVAVLEARKVGGGTTAHSTGNLYYTIDQVLTSLQSKYDNDIIRKVVTSRHQAINFIEQNVEEHKIDCEFKRLPWYMYSSNQENSEKIDMEFEAAVEAGVQMSKITQDELPFQMKKAVRVDGQAQFNAMKYVQGLANVIDSETSRIFENTRVMDVEETEGEVKVSTTGGTVTAKHAVHATHTPKGVRVKFHTVLGPYREYGVAAKLNSGDYPEGIFWGYYDKGEKFSVRSYTSNGETYVIAVGQPHKVGQAEDNSRHINNLISFLKEHFDIGEVTHRWGGQHYKPADKLPYIGRQSEDSNIFIATGFATDGLVYGSLSAMIITDLISGKKNEYSDMFKASRFTPAKSAKEFVKENVNVAAQFMKDLPFKGDEEEIKLLKNGEGRIIEKDGHKVAASRSDSGELRFHSAFCTHMSCVVHWNNAERTWDCPCHGSRFNQQGEVLEGPAISPLKEFDKEE